MSTDFEMHAGIPFARVIRVTDGKNVWGDLDDFEVRCQLRKGKSTTSGLILNLHDYMTVDFGGDDIVITWTMTGAEVRVFDANGYYDLILSDTGTTDARAIRVLDGQVHVRNTITSAAGDT